MTLGVRREPEHEDGTGQGPAPVTSGSAQGRRKWADPAKAPSLAGVGTW
jgi:hypothetical protein